jgi:hypothetical protein
VRPRSSLGAALGLLLIAAAVPAAVPAAESPAAAPGTATSPAATQVGRYRLQSNAWVNLHQRLMSEARFGTAPPARLTGDDLATWKKEVTAYAAFLGRRHPIFDVELVAINDALAAITGTALPDSIPKPAATVLAAAMPLYRAAQWDQDDRANRFFIAVAASMLASAADELAEAHARVYGVPFPTRILVDVSPCAWEFGAYTVGEGDSAHVVMTSTEPGYQGYAALEMLMHEPSHAIVGDAPPAAIGADLARATQETGIRPYASLWHAILFYTSGELTRRALADRGVGDYHPAILGMYERGFGDYRKALETHWQAYLDGKVGRYEAIKQILIETAPPKK